MKQILQNLKSGETEVVEVPSPPVRPGHLRIRTRLSLISAGTERMLVDFGRANYLDKARQQPEKVQQVLQKIGTDGLGATVNTVRARLDEPQPLGYSNVGVVTDVGEGVEGFAPGDRVVSNGRHAEVVCVPKHLCAKIPDGVTDEAAAFTVVGAIGLQGIRLLQPTLGESVVVFGLGLIGLVSVQLLRMNGCRVLGLDLSRERVELARSFGVEAVDLSGGTDPVQAVAAFTDGHGADGVLVTASTKSDEVMHQAATMSRKRGRIVMVGVTGLNLNRADFYEKELSFQVSCSYGPGRYDPAYEEGGIDYPRPFVRWTEQRNFEAVLGAMAAGQLEAPDLISARLPLDQAATAYDKVVSGEVITVLLQYPDAPAHNERTVELPAAADFRGRGTDGVRVAAIGAGNFAKARLLPALKKSGADLVAVASSGGLSSASAANKFGFRKNTNDVESIWADSSIDTVFVTTRHDSHGRLALRALEAGKHVFVEKPLTIDPEELDAIAAKYGEVGAAPERPDGPKLVVGFNRRFAPHTVELKRAVDARSEPLTAVYTANAGEIPADHWIQDPAIGGGRILGEACHFIDLLQHLVGHPVVRVFAMAMGRAPGVAVTDDKVSITLGFADGSHGTVHYFANGDKGFPKERVEVFSGGRIWQLDNFRRLHAYGGGGLLDLNLPKLSELTGGQDKGHTAGFLAFVEAVRQGRPAPIPFAEIENTMRASFAAVESLRTGRPVDLA